ncbi:MAG: hypothetical protein PHU14_08995 [Methylovulum sp.]|nr:hypothetical protein [Methylovulum sp.]
MKKITATLVLSLLPLGAFASSFEATLTVTNPANGFTPPSKTYELDTANGFFNQIKEKGFQSTFQPYGYNSTWGVTAKTLYEGVPINVTFAPDSKQLVLDIPSIGVQGLKFEGATRSSSTKLMETYLRNDTNHTYTKIVEYQVANTPNSQVAGNPTSLQGQIVSGNFNTASNITPSTTTSNSSSSKASHVSSANPMMVGVGGGTYTQGGKLDISIVSVPVSKAFEIDSNDPRKKFLLNGQFNYITVGQAASYQGSLGVGYMHPLANYCYLLPAVSYGALGSQDLATLGQIFSTSLSSNYQFKLKGLDMGFVNMFGFYKTLPLSIKGTVSSDPNINNYVFKNGIFPSKVVSLFGHDVKVKGIFTDTEFTGSKVFVRQYNEVGIELASVKKVGWLDSVTYGLVDSLSLSGKYVFSIENPNNFEGYDIGISYDF